MGSWKRNALVVSLTLIIVGTISWSFYSLVNQGAEDLLKHFGVENTYYQLMLVIGFGVMLLLLLGLSARRILKKVLE